MSGSPASIRRTASPIIGWSSISNTVILCSVNFGWVLIVVPLHGSGRGMGEDRGGDAADGQDLRRGADRGGGSGHAVDHARRLVLGDVVPTQVTELEQAVRAVAAHAGQQDGDARVG